MTEALDGAEGWLPGGMGYRWVRVGYRVVEPFRLQGYAGFAIRGALGHALKQTTCRLPGVECAECPQPVDCPYLRLFETPAALERETRFVRTNQPHPYIITPPLTGDRRFVPGGSFSFHMLVLGPGVEAMAVILAALHELGQQGMGNQRARMQLERVEVFTGWDWAACLPRTAPTNPPGLMPLPRTAFEIPALIPAGLTRLELVTVTPLRLQQEGRIVGEGGYREPLRFETLITSLLGRLVDLWNLYGESPLPLDIADYKRLARAVAVEDDHLAWSERQRHSMRQGQRQIGGLEGAITFVGDLTPFFPWLVLGERLHAGKSTAFGYGKYRLGWY